MAGPPFYNLAPDCIQHDLPGGVYGSEAIAAPFRKCFDEGGAFFQFGHGTNWNADGTVMHHATAGIWLITALGFAVSIAFIIAWVWFEHRKLIDRAAQLRAAGAFRGPGPPATGATTE